MGFPVSALLMAARHAPDSGRGATPAAMLSAKRASPRRGPGRPGLSSAWFSTLRLRRQAMSCRQRARPLPGPQAGAHPLVSGVPTADECPAPPGLRHLRHRPAFVDGPPAASSVATLLLRRMAADRETIDLSISSPGKPAPPAASRSCGRLGRPRWPRPGPSRIAAAEGCGRQPSDRAPAASHRTQPTRDHPRRAGGAMAAKPLPFARTPAA